jgi:hypothetical protein
MIVEVGAFVLLERWAMRAIFLTGLLAGAVLMAGGCTQMRVAKMDTTGKGGPVQAYENWLGIQDFEGTLGEYLGEVPNGAGMYYVESSGDQKLKFDRSAGLQSYYVWQGAHPKAPAEDYRADWLNDYEYKDCVFLFYDARAWVDRKEATAAECYVYGMRDGMCVVRFRFPWSLADVKPGE